MDITEVRVKLLSGRSDRLRAFCSITIDGEFVVHDLRIIDGKKGIFVAMPSRKLTDNCQKCSSKNHLRAAYCNNCGAELGKNRDLQNNKYHVDVAHPIVTGCRDKLMDAVLNAYREKCSDQAAVSPDPETEESGQVNACDADNGDDGPEYDFDYENEYDEYGFEEEKSEDGEELSQSLDDEDSNAADGSDDAQRSDAKNPIDGDNSGEKGGFGAGIF